MKGEKENSLPRVQHSCIVFSQVLEFLGKNSIYLLCNDFFMRDEVPVCLQLTTESRMTLNILSSFLYLPRSGTTDICQPPCLVLQKFVCIHETLSFLCTVPRILTSIVVYLSWKNNTEIFCDPNISMMHCFCSQLLVLMCFPSISVSFILLFSLYALDYYIG